MREIKFRAWDLEKKKWIGHNGTTFTSENPSEGVVALILSGHLRVFSASLVRGESEEDDLLSVGHSEYESVHPCHTEPSYKRQYILCQYTGLKDKNGKEIYEGDIFDNGHYKTQVYWNEHTCSWSHKSINVDDTLYAYIATNTTLDQKLSFEIIGNIYENPKLLKSGK